MILSWITPHHLDIPACETQMSLQELQVCILHDFTGLWPPQDNFHPSLLDNAFSLLFLSIWTSTRSDTAYKGTYYDLHMDGYLMMMFLSCSFTKLACSALYQTVDWREKKDLSFDFMISENHYNPTTVLSGFGQNVGGCLVMLFHFLFSVTQW